MEMKDKKEVVKKEVYDPTEGDENVEAGRVGIRTLESVKEVRETCECDRALHFRGRECAKVC